jgi:two-component system CheB/CheR fusion protein
VVHSVWELVVFASHNVFTDPPVRRIHLISCRNLLIYLQSSLQKRVISHVQSSLTHGGLLLLGTSEIVGKHSLCFPKVDTRCKIFRYKGGAAVEPPRFFSPETIAGTVAASADRPATSKHAAVLQEPAERVYEELISRYVPPMVLIAQRKRTEHELEQQQQLMMRVLESNPRPSPWSTPAARSSTQTDAPKNCSECPARSLPP